MKIAGNSPLECHISPIIMIAAGSLFTSCVTNTEPQGIKDIREAKADYLESLAKVKDADARFRDAETALKAAEAAVKEALAKQEEINTAIKQAQADSAIAAMKAAAEIAAVTAQEELAKAQQSLENALRKIAAEAMTLTWDEKEAIRKAIENYNTKQVNYNTWLAVLNGYKKDLWNAEYNILAGKEDYQTAESYRDSIEAYELKIATAEASIAALEALKENPDAMKDSLESFNDFIKSVAADTLAAKHKKEIYEAGDLLEANRAYKAARAAYVKDSVPKGIKFAFLDKDGKAVKYPLTNGKRLDAQFAEFVNNTAMFAFIEGGSEKTAKEYGISVDTDNKNILVGKVDADTASKEQLDAAIAIVGAIVSALNREQVVLDNIADSTTIAEAEALAAKKDSIYKADRAILAAGLDKFSAYTLAKDTVKMFQDTVKVAFSADSTAKAKLVADTAAVINATKDAASKYIAANAQFVKVANLIGTHRGPNPSAWESIHSTDSANFIAAVKALGAAQAAYFGKQDSLPLQKIVLNEDLTNYEIVPVKVAFSDLTSEGFVQKNVEGDLTSLYGGTGYGAFANNAFVSSGTKDKAYYKRSGQYHSADAITRVINVALGGKNVSEEESSFFDGANTYKWDAVLVESNVDINHWTTYDSKAGFAYDLSGNDRFKTKKDTVDNFVNECCKHFAELETLAADVKAQGVTAQALDDATSKLAAKVDNVDEAKEKYFTVHKNFWGLNSIPTNKQDTAEAVVPQKFEWNDKTFTEPFKCVRFIYDETNPELSRHILPSKTLNVILDGIYGGKEFTSGVKNADRDCRIFWGDKRTEYALALCYAQVAEDLGTYESRTSQLENINKQYAQIVADVTAKIAEIEKANEAHDAAMLKLTGKDKDEVFELVPDQNVKNGKWDLGGKQLEWAEQFAPEYPEIVAEVNFTISNLRSLIAETENLRDVIDRCYAEYLSVEDTVHKAATVALISESIKGAIEGLEGDILTYQLKITENEKLVAACEAGYSPAQAKLDAILANIEVAERYLAQAEEELKIAKKEYEAVIKKYGINE